MGTLRSFTMAACSKFDTVSTEQLDAADMLVFGRAASEDMDVIGPLDGFDVTATIEHGEPR
jgi:hypothetical protein